MHINGINIEGHKYVTFHITIAYSVHAVYNARGHYLQRFYNFASLNTLHFAQCELEICKIYKCECHGRNGAANIW